MAGRRRKINHDWKPSPEQMALWPSISGNAINGLGESTARAATPIYWHDPQATPHGRLQLWFYKQNPNEMVAEARAMRQQVIATKLPEIAATPITRTSNEWSDLVKQQALEGDGDIAGIAAMKREYLFSGVEAASYADLPWIVVIGVAMDWDAMITAPKTPAAVEVVRQYARGLKAAKYLAAYIRTQGYRAEPHCGPMAGPVLLIPPAIEAGLGELGKHGSLINRKLGASFRLACVLTDLPLIADRPDSFGVDDFCASCHLCQDACPPDAILDDKQLVRGMRKWYVDFDKCLPFFNEHSGCGICVAVCPWSRPGVADNLLLKLARRTGS